MKINELIYQTPEITEEKLLELLNARYLEFEIKTHLDKRLSQLYPEEFDKAKRLLLEYDNIQDKKSYLTASQRIMVTGFVGLCMIMMVKGYGSGSENSLGNISEVEGAGNNPTE